ncbi:helix-turn-helix domain-containing protein [Rhizobium lentis]|uniref:helix-turn-helix domain-containing protein n=1 Tax=Rhizobium TaxID=379 RepID=UPI001C82F4A0|nr:MULTISPECIES: helix-turn-helix domain-containing protein [Rhizobium]MBX4922305.1 helix-turn-helix domain-containing protein [Rhizobium bangladeshense]MBX5101188.1 helix-turn-helix domain-containing protein [Rhizobium lentis]MBY3599262.1 helix-turn-helix domain-containing protein [Rhizobium bangladeshense]
MDLLQNRSLVDRTWPPTPYDQWVDDLQSICGNFNPHAMERGGNVIGTASRIDVCGMEFAHVSNNLDYVHRDWDDIRRDSNDHLFLILQLEGACGVEHSGRQNILDVGECILVDSTRPTTFHFRGHFSNHLSLHLPRQLMYSQSKVDFDVARKLAACDPMAMMLRALIAKMMVTPESEAASPYLRQLMFDTTRQAFLSADIRAASLNSLHESAGRRMQMVDILIDKHLTESDLSAKWLATRLGVSIRTLQQDFQGMGMTCTTVIRDKRLRFAREKIEQLKEQRNATTIAEVAYSAGFNDISYFNRSFKELFDCAPSELLRSGEPVQKML